MVMIGGEKYACESCVRGHRVSNCKHEGEHYSRINPPVSPLQQLVAAVPTEMPSLHASRIVDCACSALDFYDQGQNNQRH